MCDDGLIHCGTILPPGDAKTSPGEQSRRLIPVRHVLCYVGSGGKGRGETHSPSGFSFCSRARFLDLLISVHFARRGEG